MSPPPANAGGLPHKHVRRQTRPDGLPLFETPTRCRQTHDIKPWSPAVPRRTGPARHCVSVDASRLTVWRLNVRLPSVVDRLSQSFQPISGNAGRVIEEATLAQIPPN